MSNLTLTSTVSPALKELPFQLNIYMGIFLWVTGNVGSIGNILVFSSLPFRKRAYSIYLIAEASSNFLYFNFVLMTRILEKGFRISLRKQFDPICKIRQFVSFWGNQTSFNFFAFAAADRVLSTQRSIALRSWSNQVNLAYKMIFASMFFWFLVVGHRLILYRLANGSCGPVPGFYVALDAWLEIILAAALPPLVVFVLAYLLMRNLRGMLHRRLAPADNTTVQNAQNRASSFQSMDSQLTLMIILQSFIVVITYVPFAIELAYTNLTQYQVKSAYQVAVETVIVELAHILSYVFFVAGFYISIISNAGFRRQFQLKIGMAQIKELTTIQLQTTHVAH